MLGVVPAGGIGAGFERLVVELRRYLAILRRRILLIIVTVVVGVGAAVAATPRTSIYSATTVIYVGPRAFDFNTNTVTNNQDAILAVNAVLTTFSKMIDSQPTATDAVSNTGVDRSPGAVVGKTTVTAEPSTQLLDVKVTDTDPTVAERLANGMADAFVQKVQSYQPGTATTPSSATPAQPGTAPSAPAYVFQRAALPTSPEPKGLLQNVGLGALLGLLASAGLAFLLEYLDVTIKGAGDAERQLNLPVLGIIPFERSA
jgi:capsular polysaccharide biosynthesis protein